MNDLQKAEELVMKMQEIIGTAPMNHNHIVKMLLEMAAWKDEPKTGDEYVRIKRFQANVICTNCEKYLAENEQRCAFRSLGNDYCWE